MQWRGKGHCSSHDQRHMHGQPTLITATQSARIEPHARPLPICQANTVTNSTCSLTEVVMGARRLVCPILAPLCVRRVELRDGNSASGFAHPHFQSHQPRAATRMRPQLYARLGRAHPQLAQHRAYKAEDLCNVRHVEESKTGGRVRECRRKTKRHARFVWRSGRPNTAATRRTSVHPLPLPAMKAAAQVNTDQGPWVGPCAPTSAETSLLRPSPLAACVPRCGAGTRRAAAMFEGRERCRDTMTWLGAGELQACISRTVRVPLHNAASLVSH